MSDWPRILGEQCDTVDGATGRFGYDPTNPIPCEDLGYCFNLRCPDGHRCRCYSFELSVRRRPDGHNVHRVYLECYLECNAMESRVTLFLDMDHRGLSRRVPEGLKLYQPAAPSAPAPAVGERLTIPEAARRLGISAESVRRRIRRGELQAHKESTPHGFVELVGVPQWGGLVTIAEAAWRLGFSPESVRRRIDRGELSIFLEETPGGLLRLVELPPPEGTSMPLDVTMYANHRMVFETLTELSARGKPTVIFDEPQEPPPPWWRRLWTVHAAVTAAVNVAVLVGFLLLVFILRDCR